MHVCTAKPLSALKTIVMVKDARSVPFNLIFNIVYNMFSLNISSIGITCSKRMCKLSMENDDIYIDQMFKETVLQTM